MSAFVDITPSTRILRMLGQIDFTAHQCLCELIDNSIDAFTNEDSQSSIEPEIKVSVPKGRSFNDHSTISIEDNGVGMDEAQLTSSLKAGFSNNNPIDKMGLFGMGFNISTARLGGRTEILTAKRADDHFSRVIIDFHDLESGGQFKAPIEKIKKRADQLGQHGTTITIKRLNQDLVKALLHRPKIMAKKLGKTYSRVIRNKNITLTYNSEICKPQMHCTWRKERVGSAVKGKPTNAIIELDHLIDTKRYCTSCWVWLTAQEAVCPSCNSTSTLTDRQRRVKGWIGVQRYFDADDYGIDLIRNGRVIREADKSLFYWYPENGENPELEYPIDGFQSMGRFVGEIELDFVQVTHQKDAFETNSRDWKDAVRVIRGDGPIRPLVAKSKNYAPNVSPLAELFSAFRTTTAKRENLVPRNPTTGKAMLRDPIIYDYKRRFFDGEAEYIDDEKWWDLIRRGEGKSTTSKTDHDPTGGDPFDDEPSTPHPVIDDSTLTDENSAKQRTIDEDLTGQYTLDLFKELPIRVEASYYETGYHDQGFSVRMRGRLIEFEYWPNSKIYAESLLRPADFLINELAYQFFLAADAQLSTTPLSWVERSIRVKYFPYLHPDQSEVNSQIDQFTDDLRGHLSENLPNQKDFDIAKLDQTELGQIKKKMAGSEFLNAAQIEEAIIAGEFINYASLKMMMNIFELMPSTLLDGKFFRNKINSNQQPDEVEKTYIEDAKEMLKDLVWYVANRDPSTKPIWRAKVRRVIGALEIMANWRA